MKDFLTGRITPPYRRLNLVLMLLLLFFPNTSEAQDKFAILNYNALHGFQDDSLLKQEFTNWVKDLAPDVVAYQEMNGFSQNEIGKLGERYGHPYAVIMNREYGVPVTHPLALTSKYPLLNVRRVMDNMWHGYLYAQVNGVHVFVTHLAPFTLKDRQKDIRKIIAQIALIPEEEKVLLMGDFNALSPEDSPMYGKELEDAMKKSEGKYISKSGTPIVRNRIIYRNNLNQGEVDYSVIQTILDAGFKDSFYLLNREFKHSVPTRAHAKTTSHLRRIDYIWVDQEVAPLVEEAEIIHNTTTDQLSDHYPVLIRLRLPQP